MSKVKISQEQADALECLLQEEDKETLVRERATQFVVPGYYMKKERDIVYRNMTLDTLIKALYIGYEIEPEFKVGDWIVVEDCPCKRIIGKVQKIKEVEEYSTFTRLNYDRDWFSVMSESKIRHATPEEITKEKQRRFWHSKNRDVWELKEGDTLIPKHNKHTTQIKFVEASDETGILLVGGGGEFIQEDIKKYLEKNYIVFCFREDRKDIRLGGNYKQFTKGERDVQQ